MLWLRGHKFRKVGALFSLALLVVFTLASAANTVNRIQHASGDSAPHVHSLFSEVLADDHHDADHDRVAAHGHSHEGAQDNSSDVSGSTADAMHLSKAGFSHHHGDTGASLVILTSAQSNMVFRSEQRRSPVFVRFTVTARQALPERPPRTASSTI